MNRVGYLSPFVPPEWIAAHGLRPVWLTLDRPSAPAPEARRGMCPYAAALIARQAAETVPDALILTTRCDPMRYASACLAGRPAESLFLLNVPSTWQSAGVRDYYREEIQRLGRFLLQIGGRQPTKRQLAETIGRYDQRRAAALARRRHLSARNWAAVLAGLRCGPADKIALAAEVPNSPAGVIPLALLGGPLLGTDDPFLATVERSGGCVVLDATETGERTLPGPVDFHRLEADPVDELVRIYFDAIADVFRRPNTRLYQWLEEAMSRQPVRGMILRRYPFCDLWHAELHRLRAWSRVPLLDVAVSAGADGEEARTQTRIEAFLEMLR